MIEITVDRSGLDEKVRIFPPVLARIVELTAEAARKETAETAPRGRTGHLGESWKTRKESDLTWDVYSETPYRWAKNTDNRPVDVYARNAKVLRFMVDGEFIYRRVVHRGPTTESHYIDRARESTEQRVGEFKDQALKERYGQA